MSTVVLPLATFAKTKNSSTTPTVKTHVETKLSKYAAIGVLIFSISIEALAGEPNTVGDVVGRDLSIPPFGYLGHLGLLASKDSVVQVMNATPYLNIVQYVTVKGFKTDTYWGAKAPKNFKYHFVYMNPTAEIRALANQQSPNVTYNLWSSYPNPSTYACTKKSLSGKCVTYGWTKGSFRCDAFVKWLYTQTMNPDLGGTTPRATYNSRVLTVTR